MVTVSKLLPALVAAGGMKADACTSRMIARVHFAIAEEIMITTEEFQGSRKRQRTPCLTGVSNSMKHRDRKSVV